MTKKMDLHGAVFAIFVLLMAICGFMTSAHARDRIGEVTTEINFMGPNSKIAIDAFADPKVEGAYCYISYTVRGTLNPFAEETSDASIACRQIGPSLILRIAIEQGEEVFRESRSPIFKHLKVKRFYDKERRVLVYVSYSTRLISGSAKHSISVIPVP